jgi:hypothetical protein
MFEYNFTREIIGDCYNINNPLRVDGEGNQIWLAKEVEVALPGKKFRLFCDEAVVKFEFETELTSGEQETLSDTVDAHKNNT